MGRGMEMADDSADRLRNGKKMLQAKSESSLMDECLEALHEYHTNSNVSRNTLVRSVPLSQSSTALQTGVAIAEDVSGPGIARRFAQAAAKTLSYEDAEELIRFLKHPRARLGNRKELLQRTLTERLERFYSDEVKKSGEGRERLALPGGPADADLGVILHVQSEDDTIGPFWDPRDYQAP